MRVLRLSIAALLLLAGAAFGLDPHMTLTQYGHTAWRIRDGYFASAPVAMAQTQDGFLWIGTNAGLLRFDGVRFTPWEPPAGSRLPDERIIALLGTRDGSLWIGTANGLARWHGSKLDVYLRAGRFGALLEDRAGTVWIGHTRALTEVPPLCRFEHERFDCIRFPDEDGLRYIGAVHQDRQGDLWIGGENGVCRWRRPEKLDCYQISELVALGNKVGVFRIEDAADGGLLAAGGRGIWQLTAGHWQPFRVLGDPELDADYAISVGGRDLWFAVEGRGLARRVEGRTERFDHSDGLSGDEVTSMFGDREGSAWVSTSSGLDRFRDVKVATLTAREGLRGGYFGAVAPSRDGGLWIAEKRGLLHLEASGALSGEAARGLPGNNPTSLLEDSGGRLWVGVDNGLTGWEKGRFSPLRMPDGKAVGIVIGMAEDRAGNLWVASTDRNHSLLRIRDHRVAEAFAFSTAGQQVTAIAADPAGGVWIALTHQLMKVGPGAGSQPRGILTLGSGAIDGLLADTRGLWVATSRGLGLLRPAASGAARLDLLDSRGGLPCERLEDLVAGADGSLWLEAACGLIQIPPGELQAWAAHPERRVQVRLLDAIDGVQTGRSPFSPRIARTADGRLWFALEEVGVQVLDPRSLKDNPTPPPVQVLRAVADHRTYPPRPGLRLPALTRDVEIDYTALSLAVPEKVRFRYRLEGVERDWQEAGTRREAFYTNLSPGSYRFRVIACNNDGVWNREGAAFAFAVRPAFHQTWWFLALCAAGFAGLAGSAYQWRVRQVRTSLAHVFEERLDERTRIAQDLHDTLLQGFLSASMQLYAAVEELPPEERARGRFERVQQLMRQVIDEGRAALRGLRSPDTDADDLEPSLSRVPAELGIQTDAELRVVVEGHPRRLSPVVRDEIYRISREALVNAFQHAEAAAVEVEIEYAARQLRVVVRDDGKGIDPDVLREGREGHWGLSGMRERAERIGARLQVWSRDGAGTEVELAVPGKVAYAPSSGGRDT
jgi:signal transduction histidine kinase/ligand-binding sensor domain-containing protein